MITPLLKLPLYGTLRLAGVVVPQKYKSYDKNARVGVGVGVGVAVGHGFICEIPPPACTVYLQVPSV